ncbi:MAG: hypothetical protein KC713_10300, partial [Candidatus Omnitrophica bacterium]|nr:hypothetical protein [Candidatus Omnitrophota bacterium]
AKKIVMLRTNLVFLILSKILSMIFVLKPDRCLIGCCCRYLDHHSRSSIKPLDPFIPSPSNLLPCFYS